MVLTNNSWQEITSHTWLTSFFDESAMENCGICDFGNDHHGTDWVMGYRPSPNFNKEFLPKLASKHDVEYFVATPEHLAPGVFKTGAIFFKGKYNHVWGLHDALATWGPRGPQRWYPVSTSK